MNFDINFDIDFYINAYPKAKLFYYRFGETGLKYHFLIYSKKLKIYNTIEPDNYIKYEIESSITVEDAILPENNKDIIIPRKKKNIKQKYIIIEEIYYQINLLINLLVKNTYNLILKKNYLSTVIIKITKQIMFQKL